VVDVDGGHRTKEMPVIVPNPEAPKAGSACWTGQPANMQGSCWHTALRVIAIVKGGKALELKVTDKYTRRR
jgi:hypothetical protein